MLKKGSQEVTDYGSKSPIITDPIFNELKKGAVVPETKEWKTNWKSIYIVSLVAFIGSIHQNSIMVWPYLQLLDKTATESFYGALRSVSGIGGAVSSLAAGIISNRLQDTRWAMVFGKSMALVSCLLYLSIEVMSSGRKLAFFLFELFLGISFGAANIYRTHIAMASTEEDRPKAVGICSLAPAIGLLFGPLIQLFFTMLKYPGVPFIFGTHINLFTAPILLTIIISTLALVLLVFCFDGRMRIQPFPKESKMATFPIEPVDEIKQQNSLELTQDSLKSSITTVDEVALPKVSKFDWVAVALCMFTKSVVGLTTLNFITVGPPYIMMVFQWSTSDAVKYQSVIMLLIGLHIIFWNLAYVFLNLRKRLSERKAIIMALKIPYQDELLINEVSSLSNLTATSSEPLLGCPRRFEWCATTPSINMNVFIGSIVAALGIALPLSQINLDILFSKILGRIKQGTMQGLFLVCGDGLNIVLPVVLSEVYMMSGPTYIWQFVMGMITSCVLLWMIFYKRMISNTKRLENQLADM
uniref:Uncharacterized protein n=1 Tax=Ditylenchus dipsaci TaxID=166011 RepID=A0A915D658_9BILA